MGCFGRPSSEERIATRVAEDQAVAATLTAEVTPTPGSSVGNATDSTADTATIQEVAQAAEATSTVTLTGTPTVTPTPTVTEAVAAAATSRAFRRPTATPTPIVVVQLPVPGEPDLVRSTGADNNGINLLLPGFDADEVDYPMTFENRIGMALSIFAVDSLHQRPGSGIEQVTFKVTDSATYRVVYEKVESESLYCLFGGDTIQECMPRSFTQLNYEWPNGKPIYDGDYEVEILIETKDGSDTWNLEIVILGAQKRAS